MVIKAGVLQFLHLNEKTDLVTRKIVFRFLENLQGIKLQ